MSDTSVMKLVETRWGRIAIHCNVMFIDHKWNWHWKGIVREMRSIKTGVVYGNQIH